MAITIQKPIYNHYSVDIENGEQSEIFRDYCISNNIRCYYDVIEGRDSYRIKGNCLFVAGEFGFYRKSDIQPDMLPEICFTFDEWLFYIENIPITKIEFTEFEW